MKTRSLRYTLIIGMLISSNVHAELPTSMFGMTGMLGMTGMSGMAGMSNMTMGTVSNSPIVELIAGNMRNTRGWYEQRSSGQLILYPIFPLQPVLPMLPLSPTSSMITMSNLGMAMAAGMSPPRGYAFITSQGWYTIDINGVLALHPTSASISAAPPPSAKPAETSPMSSMDGMAGMMGAP